MVMWFSMLVYNVIIIISNDQVMLEGVVSNTRNERTVIDFTAQWSGQVRDAMFIRGLFIHHDSATKICTGFSSASFYNHYYHNSHIDHRLTVLTQSHGIQQAIKFIK